MSTLTAKGRNKIDDSNFALPGRRYPIHDLAHARNALARVAQHGTPEEKKKVRAAVAAKYGSLRETTELQEFSLRGSARKTTRKMLRLPNGTFAPKGQGRELAPGHEVDLPGGGVGKVVNDSEHGMAVMYQKRMIPVQRKGVDSEHVSAGSLRYPLGMNKVMGAPSKKDIAHTRRKERIASFDRAVEKRPKEWDYSHHEGGGYDLLHRGKKIDTASGPAGAGMKLRDYEMGKRKPPLKGSRVNAQGLMELSSTKKTRDTGRAIEMDDQLAAKNKKKKKKSYITEAALRGAARKTVVELKRLPNGTFAPKGRGQVLQPGMKIKLPMPGAKTVTPGGADQTDAVIKEVGDKSSSGKPMGANQIEVNTSDGDHIIDLESGSAQLKNEMTLPANVAVGMGAKVGDLPPDKLDELEQEMTAQRDEWEKKGLPRKILDGVDDMLRDITVERARRGPGGKDIPGLSDKKRTFKVDVAANRKKAGIGKEDKGIQHTPTADEAVAAEDAARKPGGIRPQSRASLTGGTPEAKRNRRKAVRDAEKAKGEPTGMDKPNTSYDVGAYSIHKRDEPGFQVTGPNNHTSVHPTEAEALKKAQGLASAHAAGKTAAKSYQTQPHDPAAQEATGKPPAETKGERPQYKSTSPNEFAQAQRADKGLPRRSKKEMDKARVKEQTTAAATGADVKEPKKPPKTKETKGERPGYKPAKLGPEPQSPGAPKKGVVPSAENLKKAGVKVEKPGPQHRTKIESSVPPTAENMAKAKAATSGDTKAQIKGNEPRSPGSQQQLGGDAASPAQAALDAYKASGGDDPNVMAALQAALGQAPGQATKPGDPSVGFGNEQDAGLQPNSEGVDLNHMTQGQQFEMNDGQQYTYHKAVGNEFHIVKPLDGGKAKPFHGKMQPPKVGPAPGGYQTPPEEAAKLASMTGAPAPDENDLYKTLSDSVDAAKKGELPQQQDKAAKAMVGDVGGWSAAAQISQKAPAGSADLSDSPGKGPAGNDRNFGAMALPKLKQVIAELEAYKKDTIALAKAKKALVAKTNPGSMAA